jgi:hypothetical protein
MCNRIIELHDSEIAVIFYWEEDTVLIFSCAFIHQLEGVQGHDPSSGWCQRAELVIENANTLDEDMSWPREIDHGYLQLGSEILNNEIPIPLDYKGNVTIKVLTRDDENDYREIEIKGDGAKLTLLGEPVYIKERPWARLTF